MKNVVRGYEESWGFPNCGGAIDGTHIPIIALSESHGDYLNRKGYYSLIMQGVCDNKYISRDINIGCSGRVHDARVFVNSEIFHKGETSTLFPSWLKRMALPGKRDTDANCLTWRPCIPFKTMIDETLL